MMAFALLIAQSTQPVAAPHAAPDFLWAQLVPIVLMVAVFYFILFRGQRKERQRQADMLNSIKRNDRVQTIGGLYGTVVDVRDNEVVLKVDEAHNVKLRFNRSAIKEVIRDQPAPVEKKG